MGFLDKADFINSWYYDLWLYLAIAVGVMAGGTGVCAVTGTFWVSGPTFHYGLWRYCFEYMGQVYDAKCYKIRDVLHVSETHTLTQVFVITAVCLSLVILSLLISLIVVSEPFKHRRLVIFVSQITILLQALLVVIGCAVFTAGVRDDNPRDVTVGWTCYLAWAAAALSVLSGVLLTLHFALNRAHYI